MGSTNREYMRDDDGTGAPSWGHDVPTTKWLIIVTVGLFFLQTIFTHDVKFVEREEPRVAAIHFLYNVEPVAIRGVEPVAIRGFGDHVSYVEEWLELDVYKVLRGQIWRLVTFAFVHFRDAPFNLVFNMLAVWYLGSSLERMYGSRELLWFYLFSALVCGVIFTCFGLKLFLPMPLMGANPCVIALLALFATHFPRQEILFFGLIPMQIRVLLAIYIVVDVYRVLQAFSGQGTWTSVAYMSELWGAAFGYLYRQQRWRLSSIGDFFDLRRLRRTIRRASTAKNLKVFQPEVTSNLDEQVDAILAKIHEKGSESLTDRERSILQRASDRAKNRL